MTTEEKALEDKCGCLSPATDTDYRWQCGLPDGHETDCECREQGAVIRWTRPRIGNRVELDI